MNGFCHVIGDACIMFATLIGDACIMFVRAFVSFFCVTFLELCETCFSANGFFIFFSDEDNDGFVDALLVFVLGFRGRLDCSLFFAGVFSEILVYTGFTFFMLL